MKARINAMLPNPVRVFQILEGRSMSRVSTTACAHFACCFEPAHAQTIMCFARKHVGLPVHLHPVSALLTKHASYMIRSWKRLRSWTSQTSWPPGQKLPQSWRQLRGWTPPSSSDCCGLQWLQTCWKVGRSPVCSHGERPRPPAAIEHAGCAFGTNAAAAHLLTQPANKLPHAATATKGADDDGELLFSNNGVTELLTTDHPASMRGYLRHFGNECYTAWGDCAVWFEQVLLCAASCVWTEQQQ